MSVRARDRAGWLVPAFVLAVVLAPIVLTDRSFGQDWANHLWFVARQGEAISRNHAPSLFWHSDGRGVFYPWFAFYGGTLYAVVGAIGLLPVLTATGGYVVSFVLCAGWAYAGMTWLSHQAGLRRAWMQLPGLVFVTSAYYLTNMEARGAWPEFVATSMLPMTAAGAIWLVRAPRWRPLPVAAFAVTTVVLTGSHNITLVWGPTFLLCVLAAILVALPRHGRELALRRIVAVIGLGLLAALVNAWFLAPDIVLGPKTVIGANGPFVDGASYFNTWSVIFRPLRAAPAASTTPDLDVQVSLLPLLWGLGIVVLLWRARGAGEASRAWWRLGAGLVVVFGLMLLLTLREGFGASPLSSTLWTLLPEPLRFVQYAYRLHTYVALAVAGLVLVGLVGVQRLGAAGSRRRLAEGSLLGAAAVSVVLAGVQVWHAPSLILHDRGQALVSAQRLPITYAQGMEFSDASAPVIPVPRGRTVTLPAGRAAGRSTFTLRAPAGPGPIRTNITTSADLVDVHGARVLGRTKEGFMVIARPAGSDPAAPLVLRPRTARTALLTGGTALSIGALAVLVAWLATWTAMNAIRRRRPPEPDAQSRTASTV